METPPNASETMTDPERANRSEQFRIIVESGTTSCNYLVSIWIRAHTHMTHDNLRWRDEGCPIAQTHQGALQAEARDTGLIAADRQVLGTPSLVLACLHIAHQACVEAVRRLEDVANLHPLRCHPGHHLVPPSGAEQAVLQNATNPPDELAEDGLADRRGRDDLPDLHELVWASKRQLGLERAEGFRGERPSLLPTR